MKADKNKGFGIAGIYCIINLITLDVYIGKAKDIWKRIKGHITALNNRSKDENRHLINSWHKNGRNNFDYFIVEELELNETLLKERELFWQKKYRAHNRKFGYNLREDSSTNCIVSEETKVKLKKSRNLRSEKFPNLDKQVGEKTSKFWKENPDICKQMSIKVAAAIRKYKIAKLDFQTKEILEVFNTKQELKDKYPDYYIQAILGCCNGDKNSYLGFKWGYIEISTGNLIDNRKNKRSWSRQKEGLLNYKRKNN